MDFAIVEKWVKTTGGGSTGTVRRQPIQNEWTSIGVQELNIHAWEAFEKGQDIHMHAAPSRAEFLSNNFMIIKEKLKSQLKDAIVEKYGNAATQEEVPKELLLGKLRNKSNMIELAELWRHRYQKSIMKMYTLITTQVYGVHGGRTTNGATNVVSKPYESVTALNSRNCGC